MHLSRELAKEVGEAAVNTSVGTGLYFTGCIDYFDIFRQSHHTSFCYFYLPSKDAADRTFALCDWGNYAD
jgi:hypothetical protein